jgi:prepilin-type N-terminal cleavage/methylation domain-containing protein/prepilin-type processing-associated H-X9-DG protein
VNRSTTGLRTTGAFTLIELVVVVTLLAIVAAMLFPVYAKAREKARATRCMQNLRQLSMAAMLYVQDNDGALLRQAENFVPYFNDDPNAALPDCAVTKGGAKTTSWARSMLLYTEDSPALMVCPKAKDYSCKMEDTFSRDTAGVPTTHSRSSYFYNGLVSTGVPALIAPLGTLAEIHRPAELVLFSEAGGYTTSSSMLSPALIDARWTLMRTGPATSHFEGSNVAFADGHASFVPWQELLAGCDAGNRLDFGNNLNKFRSVFNPYKD